MYGWVGAAADLGGIFRLNDDDDRVGTTTEKTLSDDAFCASKVATHLYSSLPTSLASVARLCIPKSRHVRRFCASRESFLFFFFSFFFYCFLAHWSSGCVRGWGLEFGCGVPRPRASRQ